MFRLITGAMPQTLNTRPKTLNLRVQLQDETCLWYGRRSSCTTNDVRGRMVLNTADTTILHHLNMIICLFDRCSINRITLLSVPFCFPLSFQFDCPLLGGSNSYRDRMPLSPEPPT